MSVKIIADSTCDLSAQLIEQYDITILPLHIIMDEESYSDGVDVTPKMIYEWSDKTELTPTTSAPSLQEAMNVMSNAAGKDNELICFAISSVMSSSYNVMRLAAEELEIADRTYVIDSKTLSCGIGLLILEAAKMAQNGLNAAEINNRILELRDKVSVSFVVDNLQYLYRGGRCDGISMMVGSVLQLHPRISVENGTMHSTKKYRGRMNRVINDYVNDLEYDINNADRTSIFIVTSGCDQGIIEDVKSYIDTCNFANVYCVPAGGVISSHCGPGAFGLMFLNK